MECLKILLLSLAAVVGYGVLHDQVTARVCPEYFTVGHPPVFGTPRDRLVLNPAGSLGQQLHDPITGDEFIVHDRSAGPGGMSRLRVFESFPRISLRRFRHDDTSL